MKKTTKATTIKAKKAAGTKKRAGTTRASDPGAANAERVKKTRGRVVDCGGGIRQRLDHDEHGSPVLVIWRAGRGKGFAY